MKIRAFSKLTLALAALAVVGLLVGWPAKGQAIDYTFTPIAQKKFGAVGANEFRSFSIGHSEPAINDNGVVAFVASTGNTTDGIKGGVFAGDGGALTISEPQFTVLEVPGLNISSIAPVDINNSGQVVYTRSGVIYLDDVSGGPSVNVSPGVSGPFGPSINNNGLVAFKGFQSSATRIFTNSLVSPGVAGTPQVAFDTAAGHPWSGLGVPDINDSGVIGFEGFKKGVAGSGIFAGAGGLNPTTTIFLGNGHGGAATIYEPFAFDDGPAINNSNSVIVKGDLLSGGEFVAAGDGSSTSNIATGLFRTLNPAVSCPNCPIPPTFDSPAFETVGSGSNFTRFQPSINDFDQVAFFGFPRAGGTSDWGIFTGPDTSADKVLQVGDVIQLTGLGPATVSMVQFFNKEGINNKGQIVFGVNTNVGLFILRADPVPGFLPNNALAVSGGGPFTVGIGLDPTGLGIVDTAFIDTPVVPGLTGYDFTVAPGGNPLDPHLFTSVLIPDGFLIDDTFEVLFDGVTQPLLAGTPLDITSFLAGGVNAFTIQGMDIFGGDPSFFPVGVTFNHASTADVTLTPLGEPIPEPATLLLLGSGLLGLGLVRRRKRAA